MEVTAPLPELTQPLPRCDRFPFRIAKATEVAAQFLALAGGRLRIMKLVQLVYLLDRFSFSRGGHPVLGGGYLSLRSGPAASELLDLINAGRLADDEDDSWINHIEAGQQHELRLTSLPVPRYTSEGETEWIGGIWQTHGNKDEWQLREWCRGNCREWNADNSGSAITLEAIGDALGMSAADVAWIREEAQSQTFLATIFR